MPANPNINSKDLQTKTHSFSRKKNKIGLKKSHWLASQSTQIAMCILYTGKRKIEVDLGRDPRIMPEKDAFLNQSATSLWAQLNNNNNILLSGHRAQLKPGIIDSL